MYTACLKISGDPDFSRAHNQECILQCYPPLKPPSGMSREKRWDCPCINYSVENFATRSGCIAIQRYTRETVLRQKILLKLHSNQKAWALMPSNLISTRRMTQINMMLIAGPPVLRNYNAWWTR